MQKPPPKAIANPRMKRPRALHRHHHPLPHLNLSTPSPSHTRALALQVPLRPQPLVPGQKGPLHLQSRIYEANTPYVRIERSGYGPTICLRTPASTSCAGSTSANSLPPILFRISTLSWISSSNSANCTIFKSMPCEPVLISPSIPSPQTC
ncbi:hypothetical protein BC939DRAFT_449889 [Gamsiella multidivaricata]|uniref:uncharacterized protein n=1 Tax=Gamsiella multidivaricata TaxID=101098 RepID=UPI0022203378|nr:uncharacterized protein BC939DRAFT_449889 [Gamsiella multidivaricata]KAI7824733.1 hypothetical protein BC939DRAFT_449889 [Gamsiella multidivaricata]